MIFAAILAGGKGVRMGDPDRPKQYFQLCGKPLLVHTVEKFCVFGQIDAIIVLCPQELTAQTTDLVRRYCPDHRDRIYVTAGGASRNQTVARALAFIEENFEADDESLVITHDAVRPFVSYRIIKENIEQARRTGACDTVVAATDTIVESLDGRNISSIPDRDKLYQGQTPQTFNLRKLERVMEGFSEEELAGFSDACRMFTLAGEPVSLVAGDPENMKITYPHDMRVARALMEDADAQ
jgi:2-C-methyl-D-erythritol 4-phosphate cytidylyltransferase